MKKLLFTALLVSAVSTFAAITTEVPGGNKGVWLPVPVEATGEYRLFCLPLSGYDISGATIEAQLAALLPPASLAVADEVMIWTASSSAGVSYAVYRVNTAGDAWEAIPTALEGEPAVAGDGTLEAGAILWLKTAVETPFLQGQEPKAGSIVSAEIVRGTRAAPVYNLIGNPTAVSMPVTGAVAHAMVSTHSDMVMIPNAGGAYTTYYKKATGWWTPETGDVADLALQPGQAAWFVSRNPAN